MMLHVTNLSLSHVFFVGVLVEAIALIAIVAVFAVERKKLLKESVNY